MHDETSSVFQKPCRHNGNDLTMRCWNIG